MNYSASKQNGYIQANSVQSQFTQLTRERDNFHRAKEQADEDHKRTKARIQQLKGGQTRLMTQIRTIQEELGTATRKRDLLQQEQARVDRVLRSERQALEDCALHTQGLEKQDGERIKAYCGEIGELNDEIASLLQRQLNARTEALLSVESVQDVLDGKIPQSLDQEGFLSKMELMKEAKAIWEMVQDRYRRNSSTNLSSTEEHGGHPGDMDADGNGNRDDIGADAALQQMELFYGPESSEPIGGDQPSA